MPHGHSPEGALFPHAFNMSRVQDSASTRAHLFDATLFPACGVRSLKNLSLRLSLRIHWHKRTQGIGVGYLARIEVAEEVSALSFEFDDLVRYHGTKAICGLTVAYKVMEAAWETLWKEATPRRDVLTVATAFPGPGTRDGFEMVTRAVSRKAYQVLSGIVAGPLVAEAAKGAYFFRLSDDQQVIELGLKPEVVPADFVPRRRQLARGEATEADATAFRALQFAFSDSLRGLDPFEAVNVLDVRPLSG